MPKAPHKGAKGAKDYIDVSFDPATHVMQQHARGHQHQFHRNITVYAPGISEGYKQIVFFAQSCPPAPAPAPAPPAPAPPAPPAPAPPAPPSPPSQQPFSQPSPPSSPQLRTPGAYQLSETVDNLQWDLAHPEMWNDCIELSEFDGVVE